MVTFLVLVFMCLYDNRYIAIHFASEVETIFGDEILMGTPLASIERITESAVRSLGFSLLAYHINLTIFLNAFPVVEKAASGFILCYLNTLLSFS